VSSFTLGNHISEKDASGVSGRKAQLRLCQQFCAVHYSISFEMHVMSSSPPLNLLACDDHAVGRAVVAVEDVRGSCVQQVLLNSMSIAMSCS